MYGLNVGAPVSGAAGAGALAATGFNTLAVIVGACTLIAAGLAVKKLLPRRRSS